MGNGEKLKDLTWAHNRLDAWEAGQPRRARGLGGEDSRGARRQGEGRGGWGDSAFDGAWLKRSTGGWRFGLAANAAAA